MKTMKRRKRHGLPDHILDEAACWFVELNESPGSQELREGLDEWLRTSPKHVHAYLQIASHWEEYAGRSAGWLESVDELVALARDDDNVSHLFEAEPVLEAAGGRGEARRSGLRWVALAASVILTVAAGLLVWNTYFRGLHVTGIGEQRSLRLADGSTIDLNVRSRLRVRYSDRERRIELLDGQALFHVAKDATRPFIVSSGEARIQAVGTQFDVHRKPDGTTVTVLEGRVAVIPHASAQEGGSAEAPILTAGQQLTIKPLVIGVPRTVNVAAATAWTQRRLVFTAEPLSAVVEEFNRYNTRPLVITDPALEDKRISGSFSSSDPTALLTFLREVGGCEVQETQDAVYISSR